jgi:uncharacterized protein YfaQ (DUF2300 family)
VINAEKGLQILQLAQHRAYVITGMQAAAVVRRATYAQQTQIPIDAVMAVDVSIYLTQARNTTHVCIEVGIGIGV